MNHQAKATRKAKLAHFYDNAQQAEQAKDPFRFYQAIRALAPKQPFQKILLRSRTGDLLGPAEAADELQQWYESLYAASDVLPDAVSFTWPFDETELHRSLSIACFQGTGTKLCPGTNLEACSLRDCLVLTTLSH